MQEDKNGRKLSEKAIHEALKGLGSIAKAKKHEYRVFKKTKGCDDGSFRNIRGRNRNLVVVFDYIYMVKKTVHLWS
jgi:hypothetical protein